MEYWFHLPLTRFKLEIKQSYIVSPNILPSRALSLVVALKVKVPFLLTDTLKIGFGPGQFS